MIYMDNAATSFPKPPEVIAAVTAALNAPASPGRSGHLAALNASRVIHRARKNAAKIFGLTDNTRLAFMANITWALNTALDGFGLKAGDHVIASSMEHNSVARPLTRLAAERGITWEAVPAGADGLTQPDEFKKLLKPNTRLVAVNHASNVTGALTSPEEIKRLIGDVPLLVDTAQTAGAMDLSGLGLWADMIAFTGHKGLLGPTGTGGLWVRDGLDLRPLAVGGTGSASESLIPPDFMPDAFEAGTANTHGLAGLAAGLDYVLTQGPENIRRHEMELTARFIDGLSRIRGANVHGPKTPENRVATVAVSLKGWVSSDLAGALEKEAGILTRAGLHCAPLGHRALGTFEQGGLTRFSFGPFNTAEEIDTAVAALDKLAFQKR
ncbi:aminotransferase class V-fold PLP-dependent enzyme [Deltaproteobacteria bacterium OttesenSCG-928-K17]|nr:aminotransferase class V-fold PLP-dependent enzyme [Deltaproteobacteria bacterium OttesenSCG-928-K17]